jgi:hypothetical protein
LTGILEFEYQYSMGMRTYAQLILRKGMSVDVGVREQFG